MSWRNESERHRLSALGVKTTNNNGYNDYKKLHKIDKYFIKIRDRLSNRDELTKQYCVEFARALRDLIGRGDNYRLWGHNYLYVDCIFIDGKGIHYPEDFEVLPKPDPDGWAYIYNMDKLEEYKNILDEVIE